MKQLRIAVIDDGVDVEWLRTIIDMPEALHLSAFHVDAFGIRQARLPVRKNNHGSVMCMILIDSLLRLGLADFFEIISLDITDSCGVCDIDAFSHALRWAGVQDVNIVSVSMGVKEILLSSALIEAVRYVTPKTVIVAASANDGMLTYPACLPSVIGVRASSDGQTAICSRPHDGIEVCIPMPDLPISCVFKNKAGWEIPNTNSAIAPIITAQIAQGMYTGATSNDKASILVQLANAYRTPLLPKRQFYSSANAKILEIVVLVAEYPAGQCEIMRDIMYGLQRELYMNRYSCVCFCEQGNIDEYCFEVDYSRLMDCFIEYEQMIHATIYLLLVPEGLDTGDMADGLITFRQVRSDVPQYQISKQQLNDKNRLLFEIYQWILTQFS